MNHFSAWPRTTCAAVALALIVLTAGCAPPAAPPEPTASGSSPGASKPAASIDAAAIPGEMVPPGRYEMRFSAAGPDSPVADVTVPESFQLFGDEGAVLWNSDSTVGGLMLWTVWEIARDPCKSSTDADQFYDPGASVKDLAAALLRQKYRVGPEPRPVELAGYRGLYLELRFTKGFKIATCASRILTDDSTGIEGPAYLAWHSRQSDRVQYSDASIDRLWILDVKGERLIVNETHTAPGGDPVLEKMVRSIAIHPHT